MNIQYIYINWASYDELSDNVELTEELAMLQLDHMIRLRAKGVFLDYYLMDAFWYDPDGGFMEWRKPHWKNGPDKWLKKCSQNGILPGLWLPTNNLRPSKMNSFKSWKDSLSSGKDAYCLFKGHFLEGLIKAMEHWSDKGIRLFKFDFANFDAATPDAERNLLPGEIRLMNEYALRSALCEFRSKHPDVLLIAYNGFGGQISNTSLPFKKSIDARWLDCFDSIYCGDPRPADVPCMNFWRSKDIYSDHMVKDFHMNGIPLERIDSSSFMIGKTGTCYYRGKEAWRGMLILSLARGGYFNTYYGNLDLISDKDASWFRKVQSMFLQLLQYGRTQLLGGIPGKSETYGYLNTDGENAICTIINPSQEMRTVKIDIREIRTDARGKILFHDSGFTPKLENKSITLGPEQMCVIGYGEYAKSIYGLGIQKDVIIPESIRRISAKFASSGHNRITAKISPKGGGLIRIVMRQSKNGIAFRSSGGAPPKGNELGKILRIDAKIEGRTIPVEINYDKAIWSGLSWAVGEIDAERTDPLRPVEISVSSSEKDKLELDMEIFQVRKAEN